jgi:ELWxxDGT repeat protein
MRALIVLLGLLLPLACAASGSVVQVADLFTGTNSPRGGDVTAAVGFGGRHLFSAATDAEGRELWISDGTSAGTRLFADLCPGLCSSSPANFAVVQGRLYFSASDLAHGNELWVLDSIDAAPRMLADIAPGSDSSRPSPVQLVALRFSGVPVLRLYVVAERPDVGRELWRVEGDSVTLERDLRPGPESSSPDVVAGFGERRLLLTALGGDGQRAPVVLGHANASATPDSASALPGFPLPDPDSFSLRRDYPELQGRIWLVRDGRSGAQDQLWLADSSTGAATQLLSDPRLGEFAASVSLARMFFIRGSLDELFVSDGTLAGTQSMGLRAAAALRALPGQLLLYAGVNGSASNRELFRSNGTVAGTALVAEIVPGSSGVSVPTGLGHPVALSADAQSLYFVPIANELWRSDGTGAGTRRIAVSSFFNGIRALFPTAGAALFVDGDDQDEPHFASGALNELRRLAELKSDIGHSFASPLATVGERLLFNALRGGTSTQTLSVPRGSGGPVLEPAPGQAFQFFVTHLGGRAVLRSSQAGLLVTDGSVAGSSVIPNLAGASPRYAAFGPDCAPVRNGRLSGAMFTSGPDQLFESDGSIAGTRALTAFEDFLMDICSPRELSDRRSLIALGDELLVAAAIGDIAPSSGTELFAIDANGSARLVRDVMPGSASSFPNHFERLGDRVLFSADDGLHGRELWITDGTAQGTRLLVDLVPGSQGSDPIGLRRIGVRVVFAARTPGLGLEPWVTDGTEAGTQPLRDVYPGAGSSLITVDAALTARSPWLDSDDSRVLFTAATLPATADFGCPLFVSDGTSAGTRCAQDRSTPLPIAPLPPAAAAGLAADGDIVLVVHQASIGEEIALLRGGRFASLGGADLRPGAVGGAIRSLLVDGSSAWFQADDGLSGIELYRLDLLPDPPLFANGFE